MYFLSLGQSRLWPHMNSASGVGEHGGNNKVIYIVPSVRMKHGGKRVQDRVRQTT